MNLRTIQVFAIISTLLFIFDYTHAESSVKTIKLSSAVQLARQNSIDFKIALAKQKAEREKVKQVWGSIFPVIETQASIARQGADTGFLSLSKGQYDIRIVQLKFGINPGVFYNSLKATRNRYKIATEDLRRISGDIEYNVTKAYFAVIMAEEMIQLRKEAVQLFRENLKDVKSLYRTGSVPRYELLQAEVKLKNMEPLLLEAKNRHQVALDMFNYYLGVDKIVYKADKNVLKEDEHHAIVEDIDRPVYQLIGLAMKNRPEVIQLKKKRDAMDRLRKVNSSYYIWPTFFAGGYYGYNNTIPRNVRTTAVTPIGPASIDLSQISGDGRWQPNWQVYIGATYRWSSLIPLDSTRAKEREARILKEQSENELIKVKRLIAISIRSSYSNLLTAYQSIYSREENLKKAKEGLRIARASYRAGVIKNSELFAAQVALTEARLGYINAINEYYLSLASLRKETGIDDMNIIFKGEKNE